MCFNRKISVVFTLFMVLEPKEVFRHRCHVTLAYPWQGSLSCARSQY